MTETQDAPAVVFFQRLPTLFLIALLALVYFLAAHYSLELAFVATNVSPIWGPSGIALASLLLAGLRVWPAITLGAFAANLAAFLVHHDPTIPIVMASATIAIGNTLEALVGASLVRVLCGSALPFVTVKQVFRFLAVLMVACLGGAMVGASSLIYWQLAPTTVFWNVVGTWWLGDAIGMLVVAPFLLVWAFSRPRRPGPLTLVHGLLLLALMLSLSFIVFGGRQTLGIDEKLLAFLFLPCLAYAANRFGLEGLVTLGALVVVVAVAGTLNGRGPFVFSTINNSLLALDSFVLLWIGSGLVLAADAIERRSSQDFNGRDILLPWFALLISLGITVVLWDLAENTTQREAQRRLQVLATSIRDQIEGRMQDYEQVLRGGAGLFNASDGVSREQWRRYVAELDLSQRYPGIQGVGYARYLKTEAEKRQYEVSVRQEGFEGFEVRPAGKRDAYLPVTFLEPFDWRNQRAHGYDMFSEALRRRAITRARDTGHTTVSEKITLVQETDVDTQAGFLMYLPLYDGGQVPDTLRKRRAMMRGTVYSPFRVNDLIDGVLGRQSPEVFITIYDGTVPTDAGLLYQSERPKTDNTVENPNVTRTRLIRASIPVANHEWTIDVRSSPVFEQTVDHQKAQIVLVSGIAISLLLFSFVRALELTRTRAMALAQQMTSALRESETKFSTLARTASEAIFTIDGRGRILSCNPAAESVFGYSQQDLTGSHWAVLVPPGLKTRVLRNLARLIRQHMGTVVWGGEHAGDGVRRDGTVFPVEYSLSHWRSDGEDFYGVILRDITERREVKRRLHEARKSAEAASRAKSEFLANMSHEIRTPMNAVLGMTQILGRTSLNSEQRKYLEMAKSAGASLMRILDDILDFSKIEAGRMELVSVEFDIEDVIDSVAAMMTVDSDRKPIELAIGIEPGVPRQLIGDELRIRQILVNLASNAIKFTDKGEVGLLVKVLRHDRDRTLLQFSMRDTGIGMAESQRARLFNAFDQGDASITRRYGGTGLGLAICQRLVAMMDGAIEVSSQPGEGSEFTVSIPLMVASTRRDDRPPLGLGQLGVLMVDGNIAYRDYLGQTLRAWQWRTDIVSTTNEAVAAVTAANDQGEHYDLVLIDWDMPDEQGLELLDRIRRQNIEHDLYVVVMVAPYRHRQLRLMADVHQIDAVLAKPVTSSHLFDRLQDTLSRQDGVTRLWHRSPRETVEGTLTSIRLLLVEDNLLNQQVARGFLEYAGAEVDVVGDGQQALERLTVAGNRYHAVLMDVQMPVMDGLTASRRIREQLGLDVPIIAMTAGVLASERDECMAAGMRGFVAKPVEESKLIGTILDCLTSDTRQPIAEPELVASQEMFNARNLDRMLEIVSPDAARRQAFLATLHQTCREGVEPLKTAIAAWRTGEAEVSAQALHRLRGSLGSLGAERFSVMSKALESDVLAGTGSTDVILAQWRRLEQEMAGVLTALEDWLGHLDTASEQAASESTSETSAGDHDLHEFLDYLNEHNLRAQSLFPHILSSLAKALPTHELERLERAMAVLDYDTAATIVAKVVSNKGFV
ncbi:MAG: CHASE domain-containing protein [Marinobacter sp.]|nr:CHASE domain-containing protein [Marinobacter sp.]